eukprot:scaffold4621_cov194-Alexandrium_tamarense.AAC.7
MWQCSSSTLSSRPSNSHSATPLQKVQPHLQFPTPITSIVSFCCFCLRTSVERTKGTEEVPQLLDVRGQIAKRPTLLSTTTATLTDHPTPL